MTRRTYAACKVCGTVHEITGTDGLVFYPFRASACPKCFPPPPPPPPPHPAQDTVGVTYALEDNVRRWRRRIARWWDSI